MALNPNTTNQPNTRKDHIESSHNAAVKINATQTLKFVSGWVENVVEKGENDCYRDFLLFQQCFLKASFMGGGGGGEMLKLGIVR